MRKILFTERPKQSDEPMSEERKNILSWLQKVKFRHKVLGGVDEQDVWKKVSELDALYAKALAAERVRYDTLLDNYKKNIASEVRRMVAEYTKQQGKDV